MKKVYFTVGPSQIYPTIPKHINNAVKSGILSLNHRGKEFKELYKNTVVGLKELLKIPDEYSIVFTSCALEAMERTIQGCVQETSFHIVSGSFGKAWSKYAKELGKDVLIYNLDTNKYDLAEIEIPKKVEVICITQNDTSTGIWIPPQDIEKLKSRYPEKLIAIDVVSSLPYLDINYQYIDIAFFSVQKGFGLPAGLGVMILSPETIEKYEKLLQKNISIGSYHNLKNLVEKSKEFQTPETPNVLNIYLLNKVIQDMLRIGIGKIRRETDKKAKIIYDFFENHKKYSPFIKNLSLRSPTTIVIDVKGQSENLRKSLSKKGFISEGKKVSFIIGAGYGENKLNQIRIANFPGHKLIDIKSVLKLI